MRLHKRTVTLAEQPAGGWLWREHGVSYASAGQALRSIHRDDRRIARGPVVGAVATVVTWLPCTPAGTAAVRALTSEAAA